MQMMMRVPKLLAVLLPIAAAVIESFLRDDQLIAFPGARQ